MNSWRNSGTKIQSFLVEIKRLPLKRPFITALGRKTLTTNVGFTLILADGSKGYGEASASLALAHLSPQNLACTLRVLGRQAIGKDAAFAGALIAAAWKDYAHLSPAASAFECALLQALLASRGLTLAAWLGGKLKKVESDITISACDQETAFAAAAEAVWEGFKTLKVKLDGNLSKDMERLYAVRRAAPNARLYLDGNQGLTLKNALRFIEQCLKEKMPIDLMEQPLPKSDYRGMAELSKRSPVPIAADESAATPEDALRIAAEGCASVINIKVAKSGILRSLEIAAVARAAGLNLMIGCMCETAAGLSPSVHLALGTGFFRYVDLDSDWLLRPHASPSGWNRDGPLKGLIFKSYGTQQ